MKLDHPEDIIGLPLRGNCDGTTFAQEIIETGGGRGSGLRKDETSGTLGGAKVGTKQCPGKVGLCLNIINVGWINVYGCCKIGWEMGP